MLIMFRETFRLISFLTELWHWIDVNAMTCHGAIYAAQFLAGYRNQ